MVGPLPSPRHEVFAQAVACGMSASQGYALAYSGPRNGATRASAARLLTNANVKHRIAELRRGAGRRRKHLCKLSFQLSTSVPELLWRRGE